MPGSLAPSPRPGGPAPKPGRAGDAPGDAPSARRPAELPAPDPIPPEAAAGRTWDAVVVGAGPAGSTAALRLAERGHAVLLVDRKPFPRDKTCGDGLIPDALACLDAVGLGDRVRTLGFRADRTSIYSPSRVRVDVEGEFVMLQRRVLDALLLEEALRRGATFCLARVSAIEAEPGRDPVARLARSPIRLRSRILLVATGADVSLLEPLGMIERPEPSAFAVRCYVRSRVELDRPVISFDRAVLPGYGWIFPLPDGEFNVGCGVFGHGSGGGKTDLRGLFHTFVERFPLARELLRSGGEPTPLVGARLRCGLRGTRPVGPGNVVAIGESIGATFPLTGEGIGKAMETGARAADAAAEVLEGGNGQPLEELARRIEAELRPRYLGYELAERWISRPRLSDFLARRVRRSAYLRGALAGILTETVDPRAVFSVRGVVRSFWR